MRVGAAKIVAVRGDGQMGGTFFQKRSRLLADREIEDPAGLFGLGEVFENGLALAVLGRQWRKSASGRRRSFTCTLTGVADPIVAKGLANFRSGRFPVNQNHAEDDQREGENNGQNTLQHSFLFFKF